MNIDDTQIAEALDRLARTNDGFALYLFCQKTLCGVPADGSPDALRQHHGRRIFAAELMAHMRRGVKESNGGRDPTDRPIVFSVREPARVAGRERPRDFLRAIEPGPERAGDGGT